ncbi:MAG TPA: AI-2E family transporter [Isosphaeraceae bacterium]
MTDRTDAVPGQPAFTVRVLIVLGLTSLFVALALLIGFAPEVFLLAFAGVLLAVFLRGLADLVGNYTSIPAGWSLALVVLALLALIGLGGWFLASQIAAQFDQLSRSLTTSVETLQGYLRQYQWGKHLLAVPTAERLVSGRMDVMGRITGLFSTALGVIANVVVILFVGLYAAADPETYRGGLLRLVPPGRRGRAAEILGTLNLQLRRWLLGRAFNMAVVGMATTVGLWLLGVPLALALGFLAFLLDFVPYIGPIASAVPAILVALTIGPMEALYVGLLYFGVQSVESYVLTPLVQQRCSSLRRSRSSPRCSWACWRAVSASP